MAVVPYDAIGGTKLRTKKQLDHGDDQAVGKQKSATGSICLK